MSALAEFAAAHGLEYADDVELPAKGHLLSEDDLKQDGGATGELAKGEPVSLCWLTYTYRSNDTTHTVKRTAAVLRVPESIGFAPYLSAAGVGVAIDVKSFDLEGGGKVIAADGVNDQWLAELFSPAFTAWLHRNPDDFQWELTDGVLCVSREKYLTKESELAGLCADAAHIAATIREECLEEVETGEAKRTAAKAKAPSGRDAYVSAVLARTTFEKPPADVDSTRAQFREVVSSHPGTYLSAVVKTLLWMVVVNVIGGGLYGLLLNLPNPGLAVLIYQGILFVVIWYFAIVRPSATGRLATDQRSAWASKFLCPDTPVVGHSVLLARAGVIPSGERS